jgi:hypothetical protein
LALVRPCYHDSNIKENLNKAIPAQAGIHKALKTLDARLRGHDRFGLIQTFLNTLFLKFLNIGEKEARERRQRQSFYGIHTQGNLHEDFSPLQW